MLNINNSKNEKQLMPIIPNINNCKCQSFWRSDMSNFNNVNVTCVEMSYVLASTVDCHSFFETDVTTHCTIIPSSPPDLTLKLPSHQQKAVFKLIVLPSIRSYLSLKCLNFVAL